MGRRIGTMPRKAAAGARVKKRTPPSRSPLAPAAIPKLPPVAGVRLAAGEAGIRYKGRSDVLLATFAPGTKVAGVFTRSKTASAPVAWCRTQLSRGMARALVVNSGNANAFTGWLGALAVGRIAESAAAATGCRDDEVFIASTGVIGEPLPAEKITAILPRLARNATPENWRAAAQAIMTTDTWPKLASRTARIGGARVTINGIAKGSGMIAPDMATLLAFVFTDAKLPARVLQQLLRDGVQPAFNSITVDSDTSTSDTVLAFATGAAAHPAIRSAGDRRLAEFRAALNAVLLDLALQVVRDGEGARKLIQVDVSGAVSNDSARRIAFAIGNSPLVKTAIAGGDANWGRVVMAVGKAGEPADRDKLRIWFSSPVKSPPLRGSSPAQWGRGTMPSMVEGASREAHSLSSPVYGGGVVRSTTEGGIREARESVFAKKGILVAENGARARHYNERAATKAVSGREVRIAVDLGLGEGRARIYTCDLTDGYIRINASYRS